MNCSACRHENPEGSAFCESCGKRFERCCPSCGSACAAAARFCRSCGAPLAAGRGDEGEFRKVVTIVFADLIGSTALHERLDPESVSRLMDRYYQALRVPVEAHSGTVVQLLGDGVMCAFGVPRVAEDDAIRAVRAAVAMQEAFRAFARAEHAAAGSLGLRIGVNTGEVVVSDEHTAGIGDPLNVAARLQQEAGDGEVLIGESTQRLVRDGVTLAPVGAFSLKGRTETVAAYRVLSLERPTNAPATAFVGRESELRRIMNVYESAVAAPGARLVTILGSPGLGKSRLLDELVRRVGQSATVLTARCDPTGRATFAPIAEALRPLLLPDQAAGAEQLRATIDAVVRGEEAERARIADGIAALLGGRPAAAEETFFVVRRLLSSLAASQPLVLAIDDVHWAEPLLLDLTEHLVQWSAAVPLLVVVAGRPELREARSSLTTAGHDVDDVLTLAGLDAGAATRLAANVAGADELPAVIAGRVLAASEGNPLFVGELVRMLVHEGALKREGDSWTAGVAVAALEMPPTIQALLAARIERLRPEERTVLERASVVGRQFSRAAVAHLLPQEASDLDARLESLRRSELIEADTATFLDEPGLRFHHLLIRDVAYRRLLKGTRAELHARFADWLATRVGDAIEHDDTMGWHLEQAHQLLRELGPIDEQGKTLGRRAATHLAAAGRRALERDDLSLAGGLLGRAFERLEDIDAARPDLCLDWCEALLAAGDVGAGARAIEELGRLAGAASADRTDGSDRTDPSHDLARLRAWHTCFAGQLAVLTEPQALRATAEAVAEAARALAAVGDAGGEAKAHSVHALALQRLGAIGACEAALDRALAAARRAGDRRRANAVLAGAPLAALWGPSPVTRASGRCLDVVRVLRITQGAPAVEAVALRCQAVLEALRGRREAARRMIASSRRLVEELGIIQGLLETEMFAGLVEVVEGDAVAAERFLRTAYDGLRKHGLGIDAARAAALLGRTVLAQGRSAEAEALSHESEALAGDDLQAAITWRRVRAEALTARGDHAAAIDFAGAAVGIAAATDALLLHADARLALATALRAAGRVDEAATEEARAVELWQAKGAVVLVERAQRRSGRWNPRISIETNEAARAAHRRVRPNAAVAHVARLESAIATRDGAALAGLLTDGWEGVHHPTGVTYGRSGTALSWQLLFGAENPRMAHEPLATLSDSLALFRRSFSCTALATGDSESFGAVERNDVVLNEVDVYGRSPRVEFFAGERLADAIVRLFARYAELLPEGTQRDRATMTARSVGAILGPFDLQSYAKALAPEVEFVDQRLIGFPSGRGADELLRSLGTLLDTADEVGTRVEDVLRLEPDGILVRWTTFGTDRVSRGLLEYTFLRLLVFGADGAVTRAEQFDPNREEEASSRFDELIPSAPSRAVGRGSMRGRSGDDSQRPARLARRDISPNAASANAGRLNAAILARDSEALSSVMAEEYEMVHHPTGTTYGRVAALAGLHSHFSAADTRYEQEPLATLGERLALCRTRTSFGAFTEGDITVGPMSRSGIALIEVGADEKRVRSEFFTEERLGNAIARLYERHAELLPEGSARTRTATVARSIAAMLGPLDAARYATAIAPAVDFADHRLVSRFSGVGAERFLDGIRVLVDISEDSRTRVDDILRLRADALLVRWMNFGRDRASGGEFERPFLFLWAFDVHGLVDRIEAFEVDDEERALARFAELVAPPAGDPEPWTKPFANAATFSIDRFEHAWRARDWDRLVALFRPDYREIDRRTIAGFVLDPEVYFENLRPAFDMPVSGHTHELLATRGDRLALCKTRFRGRGRTAGAAEIEWLGLVAVDERGLRAEGVMFDPHDLDAAYAELEERYAAGEGAPYAELIASMRAFRAASAARNWETVARLLPEDFTLVSHRRLVGTAAPVTRDEYLATRGAVDDLGLSGDLRLDHLLRISSSSAVGVVTWFGELDGGEFENSFVVVHKHDGRRFHALELFDLDDLDTALARYEELSVAPAVSRRFANATNHSVVRFENAATRWSNRFKDAWDARDGERLAALLATGFRMLDRRKMMRLELEREDHVEGLRLMLTMESSAFKEQVLATRGDRLALQRWRFEGCGRSAGPMEAEYLQVSEVNERGDAIAMVMFDTDDLDAAYAELDRRYAAGEAAPHLATLETMEALTSAFRRAVTGGDWEAVAARLAPDFVVEDHSPLGWGTLDGPGYLDSLKTLGALAPDAQVRTDHLWLSERAVLGVHVVLGTHEGGAFEQPRVSVSEVDAQRRECRRDIYTLDQLDEAWVRFDAIPRRLASGRARQM